MQRKPPAHRVVSRVEKGRNTLGMSGSDAKSNGGPSLQQRAGGSGTDNGLLCFICGKARQKRGKRFYSYCRQHMMVNKGALQDPFLCLVLSTQELVQNFTDTNRFPKHKEFVSKDMKRPEVRIKLLCCDETSAQAIAVYRPNAKDSKIYLVASDCTDHLPAELKPHAVSPLYPRINKSHNLGFTKAEQNQLRAAVIRGKTVLFNRYDTLPLQTTTWPYNIQ